MYSSEISCFKHLKSQIDEIFDKIDPETLRVSFNWSEIKLEMGWEQAFVEEKLLKNASAKFYRLAFIN